MLHAQPINRPHHASSDNQTRRPPLSQARALITAVVRLPSGHSFGVAVTHLDHRSEELRAKQSAAVATVADAAFGVSSVSSTAGIDGAAPAATMPGGVLGEIPEGKPSGPGGAGVVSTVSACAPLAHILCGDLNSFDSGDLDAKGWDAVKGYYSSRGWPPAAGASAVLREVPLCPLISIVPF